MYDASNMKQYELKLTINYTTEAISSSDAFARALPKIINDLNNTRGMNVITKCKITEISCRKEEILRENNEEIKKIILAKCNEREREGYDSLTDSDIMDIIEECERRGIEVTREKLKEFGID